MDGFNLLREDISRLSDQLNAKIDAGMAHMNVKIDNISASSARRDELIRVETEVTKLMPRQEVTSRWEESDRRVRSLESSIDGMRSGRYEERLDYLERVGYTKIEVLAEKAYTEGYRREDAAKLEGRLKDMESDRLPKWFITAFGFSLATVTSVVTVIIGHFWKS